MLTIHLVIIPFISWNKLILNYLKNEINFI
jgi:hypothetical protein